MTGRRGWKEITLGELVEIIHGYAFDGASISDSPAAHILLTPLNFKAGGGFSSARFKYYAGEAGLFPPQYILVPGDMIVALTDLGPRGDILGRPAIIPKMREQFLHNQRIGKIRFLSGQIREDFLYWLMRSKFYRHHILSTASGSTVKHTSPGGIGSFRFFLPPLPEQASVTSFFNALETRISLLERSNDILEKIAATIFREHFRRVFAPVPLSAFGRVICGRTPSKDEREYFGGPFPFVKIPDMKNRVFITRTGETLSDRGAASQYRKQIPPHSICVSCIGTIGIVAITSTCCHTNQQINTVVPYHHRDTYYLYCRLKRMGNHLASLGSGGSTTLNANTGYFSMLPIPAPPVSLLEGFHRLVHPVFRRILLNLRQIESLEMIRDTLLSPAISGKLVFPAATGSEVKG
jgi:type I restriction enzyme S subunit